MRGCFISGDPRISLKGTGGTQRDLESSWRVAIAAPFSREFYGPSRFEGSLSPILRASSA